MHNLNSMHSTSYFNNLSKKVKQRYRDGLILNSIYGRLKQKKFKIRLFYLFKEGIRIKKHGR